MQQIIYRETAGAGDDQEAQNPNGIVVTLSYWESDDWRLRSQSHYLLHSMVIIEREIITDEIHIIRSRYRDDAKYIRGAIATMDTLKGLNPEAVVEGEPQ